MIWSVELILIIGLLVLGLVAWRYLFVPRLASTPLPPYEIPDLILVGGLLVENRGRAPASNLKIEIAYDQANSAKIQHMHVASDEPYILRGGGEQFSFATIRLDKLGPGRKLFVYWASGSEVQPHISVTSYSPARGLALSALSANWSGLVRNLKEHLSPNPKLHQ